MYPSAFTRISYQVGNPWMFDGNTFLPDTGTPIRNSACSSSPFALADPVPLTVAIFRPKSLTPWLLSWAKVPVPRRG